MADGFEVEIREEPRGVFTERLIPKKIFTTVQKAMDAIGAHAAERAQANAPIDTSDLRRSIRHVVRTEGVVVVAKVLAGEPYALRMHEQLTPAGPLQLGPTSRNQPATPEGGVGGKFIERVVNFHAKTYENYLAAQLRSNLSKADAETVKVHRITRGTS